MFTAGSVDAATPPFVGELSVTTQNKRLLKHKTVAASRMDGANCDLAKA